MQINENTFLYVCRCNVINTISSKEQLVENIKCANPKCKQIINIYTTNSIKEEGK